MIHRRATIIHVWSTINVETLGNLRMQWAQQTPKIQVVADPSSLQYIFLAWENISYEIRSYTAQQKSTDLRSSSACLLGSKVCRVELRSLWFCVVLGMLMTTRQTRTRVFALITLLWLSDVARHLRGAEPCRQRWKVAANFSLTFL